MTAAPIADVAPIFAPEAKKEFLLAIIRRGRAQLQALILELDEIGISLKYGMIDAEGAVSWLDYIGAMKLANIEPWTNRVEVPAKPEMTHTPAPTAGAADIHRAFNRKMAPGGEIDQILRGGRS